MGGLIDQHVDHLLQRRRAILARLERGAKGTLLAMGAGTTSDDVARVLNLPDAVETLGILAYQRDDLVDQFRVGYPLALA